MTTSYPSPPMESVELVEVLKALADPTRLQIVRSLSTGGPLPKHDLVEGINAQKSALAYHFRTLREAGITNTLVHGRTHDIQLRRDELDAKFPGLITALLAAEGA